MMANTCIFCGKPENLNTSMTIQVDEGKVKVDICDDCAEEATLKKAREAYQKKMEAIKDILAQARALGFELQPNTPGQKIEVIQQAQQLRQQQVPQVPQPQ